jgi:lipopolysaccharide/colanic/teichoic acid biosynthesis glycosyltransferase
VTDLSEQGRAGSHRQQSTAGRGGDAPKRALGDAAKRVLDIVVSGAALVLLAPLLGVLWLLVRLTSPGPGFFRQERLGRGMQPFSMLKLRSMYTGDSDRIHREYIARLVAGDQEPGPRGLLKLEADPRITRVGAWLRRTSLDELPQLFNVLRGDMSLVGPRPALAWEAEMWLEAYSEYPCRFEVRPGITGLWQVSGRSRLSVEETLKLDTEYVQRYGFGLDLLILARTLPALFSDGAS